MKKQLERFVVMLEWETPLTNLSNEQKGILFQLLFDYHNGLDVEITDPMVKLAWSFLEPNIERINHNYITKVNNGKKGGRPKKTEQKPNNNLNKPNPNLTETDKEKDKDKEKEKEKDKEKENATSNAPGKIIEADWTWSDNDYKKYWSQGYTVMYNGESVEEGDLLTTF